VVNNQPSWFEAGSCLRRIDLVYHSTLGLRVIEKKKRKSPEPSTARDQVEEIVAWLNANRTAEMKDTEPRKRTLDEVSY